MTHIYKAKCYSILKVDGIPIELQEDTIFHCDTDLLLVDINIEYNYFDELIDDNWISLDTFKKLRSI